MRSSQYKKLTALYRLFKYVDFNSALSFLSRKERGPIAFKDGTKTTLLSGTLLNLLPFKDPLPSSNGLFLWRIDGEKWFANYEQIVGLNEYIEQKIDTFYAADYADKRVLDIGGFIGDSARFFIAKKANKVTIYEPSLQNVSAMRFNLQESLEKITIHQKALYYSDKMMHISSDEAEGRPGFGLKEGGHRLTCQGVSLENMLNNDRFDIVKVDCEGGEKYLLPASTKLLQKIPYWMIETHNQSLHHNMICKFERCGFNKVKEFKVAQGVHVVHFALNSLPLASSIFSTTPNARAKWTHT